jgi:hypothetical protein
MSRKRAVFIASAAPSSIGARQRCSYFNVPKNRSMTPSVRAPDAGPDHQTLGGRNLEGVASCLLGKHLP